MTPRSAWLLAVGLAAVVGIGFQGSRGLYESTEGRYAEVAREMNRSGEYLEPTLAGRPHWTKPPATYWSIAAGLRAFGDNAWGARLPNAVAFILTAVLVGAAGAALWDTGTGALAALVYATSLFPVAAASTLSADTLLAFVLMGMMAAWILAWRSPDATGERRWIRLFWLAAGIAFFVKGPPALLPLLAIVLFQRFAHDRPRLLDATGICGFVIVAGWWYALSALRHPGLLGYFLGDEVVGRIATSRHGRNPQWYKPFTVYLPVLLLGPGAWLIPAAPVAWRNGLHRPGVWRARLSAGGPAALLAVWLLVPLAVFSLARSRLPLYVLPLYPPIALGIARALQFRDARTARRLPRSALVVALAATLILLVAKDVAAHVHSQNDMRALAADVRNAAGPGAPLWLFEEDRMFGLDFYLDGEVRRVTRTGDEPWADASLAGLLEGAPRGATLTLLGSGRARDSLRARLQSRDVQVTITALDRRDLFRIRTDAKAGEPQ